MGRRNGIITLTTDFGTRDAYVGAMKGVICSILPSARIVDISHEIRPQKILEAAFLLEATYPWFPPGTVHVAVVDPGVGTKRRPLAVEADGQFFVGPDNGVLSAPLGGRGVLVREITEKAYALPEQSETFHGRDVFAPAAGHIASGLQIDLLGSAVSDAVVLDLPKPEVVGTRISGEIVRLDRFGNALSNIPRAILYQIGLGPYRVSAAGKDFGALHRRYQDVPEGETLALTGGDGRVEIAINGGSAAESHGLAPGDAMIVEQTEDGS